MSNEIPTIYSFGSGKELASLGSRLAGQVIDGVITIAIVVVGVFLGGISDLLGTVMVLGALGYYLLCDGLPGGQSVGKRVMGIACVNTDDGQPCGYGRSAARNITQVLGLFDWLWIFGSTRRRAGDLLAHTSVIRA